MSTSTLECGLILLQGTKHAQFALDLPLGCLQPFDLVSESLVEHAGSLVDRHLEAGQDFLDARAAQPGGEQVLDEDDALNDSSFEVTPPFAGSRGSEETETLVVPERPSAHPGES